VKYSIESVIHLPRDQVTALYGDPEHYPKWQAGLAGRELMEGTPGVVGAKHKVLFQMGKRSMEMTETLITNDMPDEFTLEYEAKGVDRNRVRTLFSDTEGGDTKLVVEQEFEFSGCMKVMGFLVPGAFKKQSQRYMDAFKAFAENGTDVRNA